ncbi:hypothetical protein HYS49_03385 [Candidatus Woesearchaeota archaeon]|nr:hypothetical protein [Candidatus Woesearchaeota archaeon]
MFFNNPSGKAQVLALLLAALLLGAFLFYLLAATPQMKVYSLILFLLVLVIDIVFIALALWSRSAALGKKIEQAKERASTASLDELKQRYQEIYQQYLRLHEPEKQKFYSSVVGLRQAIEEHLTSQRKLSETVAQAASGTFSQKKLQYQQAQALFETLPTGMQQEHTLHMAHLKEQLEKGRG